MTLKRFIFHTPWFWAGWCFASALNDFGIGLDQVAAHKGHTMLWSAGLMALIGAINWRAGRKQNFASGLVAAHALGGQLPPELDSKVGAVLAEIRATHFTGAAPAPPTSLSPAGL